MYTRALDVRVIGDRAAGGTVLRKKTERPDKFNRAAKEEVTGREKQSKGNKKYPWTEWSEILEKPIK